MIGHLYDCVNIPDYHIRKPFGLMKPYLLLNSQTTLISAASPVPVITVYEYQAESLMHRPTGTKKAKTLTREHSGGRSRHVNEIVAVAVTNIKDTIALNQQVKQAVEI